MKTARIILNQDVYNLGEEGDVCEVAPGYARNYLLPKGFAVSYNTRSLSLLAQKQEMIENRKREKQDAAKGLRERLESLEIILEMPAGNAGRLFGSVTNATLSDYFSSQGITIERKKIQIPDHSIKMVGVTKVQIRLYGEEVAEVGIEVVSVGGKRSSAKSAAKAEAKVSEDSSGEQKAEPAADAETSEIVGEDSESSAEAAPDEE